MKMFFVVVLVYYFFVVQYIWKSILDISELTRWAINMIFITAVVVLYYQSRKHKKYWQHIKNIVIHTHKNIYISTKKYLFVWTLLLFVSVTILQLFSIIAYNYAIWILAILLIMFFFIMDAIQESKLYFWQHLFLHKEIIFWLSLGISLLWVQYLLLPLSSTILFWLLIGYVLYVFFIKKTNSIWTYSIRKLFTTKLYIWAIILALIYVVTLKYPTTTQTIGDYGKRILSGYWNRTNQAREIVKNPIQNDPNDIVVVEQVSDVMIMPGNNIEDQQQESIKTQEETPAQEDILLQENTELQVTFTQALNYLFDKYNIPLSTATNTRFSNISFSDGRYSLFKTAHEKRLLWADINPDSIVRCDVYMVMQGIVAWRSVGTQKDVFDRYRTAAQANNAVNGCIRGAMLRMKNL